MLGAYESGRARTCGNGALLEHAPSVRKVQELWRQNSDGMAVTTPVVDVGRVPAGEITNGTVEVISLTGAEEQVAYISMKCQCAEFDLPATLPPERATPIGFRLRAPNEPGAFRRPAGVKSSAGEVRFEMVGVAVASQ